jgi:glycosyltransferase involved in cell wall biosynthesis
VVSLFPCWSETFIVREILALQRRGVEVRILSLKPPSEAMMQPDARTLSEHRTIYPPADLKALRAALRVARLAPTTHLSLLARIARGLLTRPRELVASIATWWRALAVVSRIRDFSPDLIHAHWATYPSTAAMALSRALGVPFSFTAHAHDIFLDPQLLREKLRDALFAVTVSRYNGDWLGERHGRAAVERLHIVHCGVSLGDLAFHPEGRSSDFILAVARLEPIKGLSYLVEACAILRDRGRRLRCEIVGEGTERPILEAAIRRHRLEGVVALAGASSQHDVRARLDRATVFVLPSVITPQGDRDGVPVALMEAMASGLPVVSTTTSGIPELVEDGTSGILVPPNDPAALAAAIDRVLLDGDLRRYLATNARRTVERGFDADREAGRLLKLMEASRASRRS